MSTHFKNILTFVAAALVLVTVNAAALLFGQWLGGKLAKIIVDAFFTSED